MTSSEENYNAPPRIANADGYPVTPPIPSTQLTPTLLPFPREHLRSLPIPPSWTRYYSMPQTDVSSTLS